MTLNKTQEIWIVLNSRSVGGIETHVLNLAEGLKELEFNPKVVFLKCYGAHPIEPKLQAANIKVEYLDGKAPSLCKAIKRQRPQLIHTHGYKAGILGKLCGKKLNLPVVSTYHAGDPGNGKVKLYNWLDRCLQGLSINIAINARIAEKLNSNAHLIPNFVQLPHESVKTNNQRTVAFVGRLCHDKGPDIFCELATHLPMLNFEVYGSGPLLEKMQKDCQMNFHTDVSDMEQHWQSIDILCITSRYEDMPLAALESMAHHTPVISFAVGELSSLISQNDNGFLAPAGDIASMVTLINNYFNLSLEEKQHIQQNAYNTIQKKYSSTIIMPKIIAVYDEALG